MIVSFLDILGFSALLKSNPEVAYDSLSTFNELIRTNIFDAKTHPLEEYSYDAQLYEFAQNSSITSFENLISFSDSLVIGSNDVNLFTRQLMYFVSTIYINSTKPFRIPFENFKDVYNFSYASFESDSMRPHNAVPILFRGGLSFGDDVCFFNETRILDTKVDHRALNVTGKVYLNAVLLEKSGKGPHLFCDSSVVKVLSEEIREMYVREYDKENDIYEILWTIAACETNECSSYSWDNVTRSIHDKLLPSTIYLYNYYNKNYSNLEPYYLSLLKLVYNGIAEYAKIKCDKEDKAKETMNEELSRRGFGNVIQLIS